MKQIFLGCMVFLMGCSVNDKVEWVSTTIEAPWVKTKGAFISKNTNKEVIHIEVASQQQVVDGFGGCFNELGWEAIKSLSADKQKEVFESLFESEKGCRFNIFRMPIGANDYAVDWYSHNETPDDYGMENFSLERDRQRLMPYIKTAQLYDPSIKIWASPWCPPSWMKTNGHYACKPNPKFNDLPEEKRGTEMVTQFRMEPQVLQSYALYFEKFIRGYKDEGIDIYAVHVQNEMNSCQPFPSCIWRPEDLAGFIGNYLGPQIQKSGLETEIWYGTVERTHVERVDTVLLHPEASKYIAGVGFQWAGKGAIPEISRKYPNLKLMQTETECGNGSNDWAAAEHTFGLIKHYFIHRANSYMYWNMVLDETGQSQWGWKQNSMITIDRAAGTITYNPEYYLMKHFSYFVEPGSVFIPVPGDENCLPFLKNNRLVVFYYNEAEKSTQKSFAVKGRTISAEFAPKSMNTLVIRL